MKEVLAKLATRHALTEQESYETMSTLLNGQFTDVEIAAFLMGLRTKGEVVDELYGILKALQEHVVPIQFDGDKLFDNCGTGGDGLKTFNISTTTAFVCSAGGLNVAKHGNRSITSQSGSADVLESLGANIYPSLETLGKQLHENGITFLFAQHVHPKLARIGAIRKQLGIVTSFNLLGPLANPLPLTHQLVGVFQEESMLLTAQLLQKLGRKRALVVHGTPGADEATLAGETKIFIVTPNQIKEERIRPEEFGLSRTEIQAIKGGNAMRNREILLSVLKGEETAYYETVLLNSGLCFYASESVRTIEEGIQYAKSVIKSGEALQKLYQYIKSSQEEK